MGLDEVFPHELGMSRQEIIERFKRVFGREMTAVEEKSFFLDLPLPDKTIE